MRPRPKRPHGDPQGCRAAGDLATRARAVSPHTRHQQSTSTPRKPRGNSNTWPQHLRVEKKNSYTYAYEKTSKGTAPAKAQSPPPHRAVTDKPTTKQNNGGATSQHTGTHEWRALGRYQVGATTRSHTKPVTKTTQTTKRYTIYRYPVIASSDGQMGSLLFVDRHHLWRRYTICT